MLSKPSHQSGHITHTTNWPNAHTHVMTRVLKHMLFQSDDMILWCITLDSTPRPRSRHSFGNNGTAWASLAASEQLLLGNKSEELSVQSNMILRSTNERSRFITGKQQQLGRYCFVSYCYILHSTDSQCSINTTVLSPFPGITVTVTEMFVTNDVTS